MEPSSLIWIFFIYGLAFFVLGAVLLLYPKGGSPFALAEGLVLIGFFGIFHGINEWMDMFKLIYPAGSMPLKTVQLMALPGSFYFLVLFGTKAIINKHGKSIVLRTIPVLLLIIWAAFTVGNSRKFLMGDIAARYLLGAPGIVLTCYALLLHIPEIIAQGQIRIVRWLKVTAGTFMAYGFFSAFIVPQAAFFPASVFNYTVFLNVTGVPVQMFRTFCAIVLFFSITRMLTFFEWEMVASLREAYYKLEERVRERTAALQEVNKQLLNSIDDRKLTEAALRKSEEKLNGIMSNVAEGIYVLDENGRITFMNPEAERLLGWTIDELNEKGVHDLIHCHRANGTRLSLEECNIFGVIKTGKRFSSTDEVFMRKDGSVFPVSVISAPLIEDGRITAAVTAFRDITEIKHMEKEILHIAHHDTLTGLPNRMLFLDLLNRELAKSQRYQKKLAVLFLDLDRFKYINDTLGHDIGDMFLKEVAERLRHSIRESDTIARIGGDEFNILLTDIAHAEDISAIAGKITDSFKAPFWISGHELHSSTSIGISIYPDDADTTDALFKSADIAMYRAKERGGNTYQFYNTSM